MQNPLLQPFDTPFQTPPFGIIEKEHFLPALQEGLVEGRAAVARIADSSDAPTFANTCEALEQASERVDTVAGIFFNLYGAEFSDRLQDLAKEMSPLLAEYSNDVLLNSALFARIKTVYEGREEMGLDGEAARLLEKQYRNFTRNGALLSEEDKKRLRAIDQELSKVSLLFSDNVLAETNGYELAIERKEDLAGLPESVRKAAERDGKWVFTLDYPSYLPFMKYADNRHLRQRLFMANATKACKGDERDNCQHIARIARLRRERADLLGYASHAHFVLQNRMAEEPGKVWAFLQDLQSQAKAAGERDVAEVAAFAREHGFAGELQTWDYPYWAEKLKRSKFSLDDEVLRPYFDLEKVLDGVFQTAGRLYGLSFTPREDIPVYHEEVRAFEVRDREGEHLGVFYGDFFPRPGKRAGAWMTNFRSQREGVRPHVSIVCNFSRPGEDTPALLTFQEVTTLFHEFGHSLHSLLSRCRYEGLSGTSVAWDFVELPSQLMENWAYQKECLDLFAVHYQTGEKIPADLVEKLKAAAAFQEGFQTLRQVGLATLDMSWHDEGGNPPGQDCGIEEVHAFEQKVTEEVRLLPPVPATSVSCSFGHIFSGGYSAGYYSYKWAEVLDADAFEHFAGEGVFNSEVAAKFRSCVLEKGDTRPAAELYREFRGRDATPAALLKRAGLAQESAR